MAEAVAGGLAHRAQRSLLSRVMLGVLSLLMVGGCVVTLAAFVYGRTAAQQAYDRLLVGAARDIAESIDIIDGAPVADIPVSTFGLLALSLDDRISYAVRGPDGTLLTGYADAHPPASGPVPGRDPIYFDARMQGEGARYVTIVRRFSERDYSGRVSITVGQTLRARNAMALDITRGALLVTGLGGLALILGAFLVIRSAMRPLERLAEQLLARDPYDLTPMPEDGPAEVAVTVHALNRFMARLDRQVGAMKHLISDTAHQLRTPVAAIRAQAELALEDDADHLPHRLERLLRRTRSLGSLLDQMLSRALVIHRTDNAPPEAVDLRDVALLVLEQRDHEVLAPGIEVELVIGEAAVLVLADEISLCEAVKNMLGNALRHGAAPVRIGVTAGAATAEIWVEDAGDGPPEDLLTRIGGRFERAAASRGNSAGLGLSIVRAVAEAFGGTLRMGRGEAGFRVTLALPEHSAAPSQGTPT
ncbi:sensor histidine kinase [Pseudooceanicola sediminis]|uniref:histidine kinase n=1 Tax=Pseudooceanicola sediminis TaxID=2211117 RepID=A0A399J1A0_9RHOB|nr:sensor histidine kinase [Pseudooceanicola sediminis]KAA2316282.1 sensor histidine kinase [Puniceibacterium sp. HSS470]RII39193.1 sensor histidine kinase [Pseudooceanicola sediminis]|tara:strand:+ start:44960 stop:46384 length:1425 start_codon:yes stop_codon:yes gene_type:complete